MTLKSSHIFGLFSAILRYSSLKYRSGYCGAVQIYDLVNSSQARLSRENMVTAVVRLAASKWSGHYILSTAELLSYEWKSRILERVGLVALEFRSAHVVFHPGFVHEPGLHYFPGNEGALHC